MHEALAYVDLQNAGNAQAQLLLYAIARHADCDTGACEVSQSILARMAKCSVRTCRNYLLKLEQDNLISRKQRCGENGGRLSDELTLVGYQEWVSTIRKGGFVKAPIVINSYDPPADLAAPPPANLADGGSLKDQENLDTPSGKSCRPSGKQVAGIERINNKLINNKYFLGAEDFYQQLIEAAGPCLDDPKKTLGLLNEGTPQSWIAEGADLELDILPTLRACAKRFEGKKIQSWNYFTQPILAQKVARETVTNANVSDASNRTPNKKNAEANTNCGFQLETRVYFHNEKLKLCDELNNDWLKSFDGQQDDLNLALIQIAAYVQPNSPTRSLETQVASQLARIARERREKTARYNAAAKSKPINGKPNFHASKTDDALDRANQKFWDRVEKGEIKL